MAEVAKIARDLIERFKTLFWVVLAVLVVVGSNIYRSLHVYWSNREIVIIVCVFPILLLFILSATVRAVSRRRGTPLPSAREMVSTLRNGRPPAPPFDWIEAMNSVYKPGRRISTLPVGLNKSGQFVGVSMRDNESHVMTVGASGSGKSSLVNQMLIAAHNSSLYQIVIYTIKPGDLAPIEALKNIHLIRYDNEWDRYAEDMPQILQSVNDEIQRRVARLSQLGKANIWDLRSDQRPPLFLLVIEELGDLVDRVQASGGRQARDEFLMTLKNCLNIGRAAGVHIFLVDQRPTGNIPQNIRVASVALPFRVRNRQEAYWATGVQDSKAETLQSLDRDREISPEVMIVRPLGNERVKIPWITDDDIHMLIRLSDQENVTDFGYPLWLYGYTAPIRPVTAENVIEGTFTAPTPATALVGDSSHPTSEADTASLVEHIQNLYDTNPEFKRLTNAFYLERGQLAALGHMAGMSQNSRMRGLFNKNTNGRYREFLNLIDGAVADWQDGQTGQES